GGLTSPGRLVLSSLSLSCSGGGDGSSFPVVWMVRSHGKRGAIAPTVVIVRVAATASPASAPTDRVALTPRSMSAILDRCGTEDLGIHLMVNSISADIIARRKSATPLHTSGGP